MKPRHLKLLHQKAKRLKTIIIDSNTVLVQSQKTPNHIVTLRPRRDGSGTIEAHCTCAWALHGGIACSHVLAALTVLAAQKKRQVSFWLTPEEAQRQRHHILQVTGEKGNSIWITSRSEKRTA